MNITIDKLIVDSNDYTPDIYHVTTGKSGRIWVYSTEKGAAEFIWVSANPEENAPGYRGFRGYGGGTLTFPILGGTIALTGPWHSNADSLYEDTGVDMRDRQVSYCIVSMDRIYDEFFHPCMIGVLHTDREPMEGSRDRGEHIAKYFANKLGMTVYLYSETCGGSMCGPFSPEDA